MSWDFTRALAICSLLAGTAAAAPAHGQFSLFGNATIEGGRRAQQTVELVSDITADEPYAGISFVAKSRGKQTLTLADIDTLSTTYQILEGGFGGGSLRFSIGLDEDGDGEADGNVFVYLGEAPNFTEDPNGWVSTGNLIESQDLRFDTGQIGGTFYDSYDNAVQLAGDAEVVYVDLVLDSGWFFEDGVQSVLIGDMQVNNSKIRINKLND